MRKPIEQCPACGGELIVTQQTCVDCHTMVVGQFKPNIFSKLSQEHLSFVEVFVKNKGNIKEMERELATSYWTIRNQLNDVIAALGFETDDTPAAVDTEKRQDILARLDRGVIDVAEATKQLQQLAAK
ncbi:MAG: DUF2089 domain-containing protein [Chloroflexi bacterium]|nr:MAG: DUF2089 domain-containing protein [Chloroflexota bacterium]